MNPCVAVFDVGTTAVKVCLFSPELTLLAISRQEYALRTHGEYVEATLDTYCRAICNGLQEAMDHAKGCDICAICLTTQGETLAPYDAEGNPLMPFIVWLDGRAQLQSDTIRHQIPDETFYLTTGLPEMSGTLPLAKLLWISEQLPDIASKTRSYLLLEDALLLWLTGKYVTEKSLQTSTGWFSLEEDDFSEELLSLAHASRDSFPQMLDSGELAGTLTDSAAGKLGLHAGIPVYTGAMDQTAAALYAGRGQITETTGTALVMTKPSACPMVDARLRITVYRHALRHQFLTLPIGNTAGMALKWFRDVFCSDLPHGYDDMNALAQTVPPGSDGLTFLPHLAGRAAPNANENAVGMFYGMRLSTRRAHCIRAIMESLSFMTREFLELPAMQSDSDTVIALGGGTNSTVLMQMKADVCGKRFIVPECAEATAAGAALLAMWGSGMIQKGSYPPMRTEKIYIPNPDNKPIYDECYDTYQKLNRMIEPMYERRHTDE